jgi:hypothetical protein
MIKFIPFLLLKISLFLAFCQKEKQSTISPSIELNMSNKINVKIGNKTFTATLVDNATSKAFVAQLPLTINMIELNNNEKYAELPKALPTNASVPSSIQAGDLMMYGSSTLVLFYKGFSTSYSYTKIGKIDDVAGLISALGTGDVTVIYEVLND